MGPEALQLCLISIYLSRVFCLHPVPTPEFFFSSQVSLMAWSDGAWQFTKLALYNIPFTVHLGGSAGGKSHLQWPLGWKEHSK